MTTCEDCIHCQVCDEQKKINHRVSKSVCKHFKDKSQIIELPCEIGDTVYCLSKGQIIEKRIVVFIRYAYITIAFFNAELTDSCTICDFGKTVFLTRKEAEQALKERRKSNGSTTNDI